MRDDQLALARRLGATNTVNVSSDESTEQLAQLVGRGVDHAFEAVGRSATVEQAVSLAAPGRTAYVVGMLPDSSAVSLSAAALRAAKSVVGMFMGSAAPRDDIPRYIDLWRSGLLDLEAMVGDVYSLDEVNTGFSVLASGRIGRGVVQLR